MSRRRVWVRLAPSTAPRTRSAAPERSTSSSAQSVSVSVRGLTTNNRSGETPKRSAPRAISRPRSASHAGGATRAISRGRSLDAVDAAVRANRKPRLAAAPRHPAAWVSSRPGQGAKAGPSARAGGGAKPDTVEGGTARSTIRRSPRVGGGSALGPRRAAGTRLSWTICSHFVLISSGVNAPPRPGSRRPVNFANGLQWSDACAKPVDRSISPLPGADA